MSVALRDEVGMYLDEGPFERTPTVEAKGLTEVSLAMGAAMLYGDTDVAAEAPARGGGGLWCWWPL